MHRHKLNCPLQIHLSLGVVSQLTARSKQTFEEARVVGVVVPAEISLAKLGINNVNL